MSNSELENAFTLKLAFHWPHKFVVSWPFYAFLILAISFWELISQHVHVVIRLQFYVQTATYLRFAQSMIPWKPLHEFKPQFLLRHLNFNLFMTHQSVIQLHETRFPSDNKFALVVTEMCLIDENKMCKDEILLKNPARYPNKSIMMKLAYHWPQN